jgi:hypothetical protein
VAAAALIGSLGLSVRVYFWIVSIFRKPRHARVILFRWPLRIAMRKNLHRTTTIRDIHNSMIRVNNRS